MIAYYRVSTRRQGKSGLGLDAQREAVAAHVKQRGCDLIASYCEVETAKRSDIDNRPELRRAIAHAKRAKATLVVAKLDRLSRSVAVIAKMLDEGKVRFVCCDNPEADELTIGIHSVVAQREAKLISKRTKDALAAAKARGTLLGAANPRCRRLTNDDRVKGALAAGETHRASADEAYGDLIDWMVGVRGKNWTLQAIADHLNDNGEETRRGKPWNPMQVTRVLDRA